LSDPDLFVYPDGLYSTGGREVGRRLPSEAWAAAAPETEYGAGKYGINLHGDELHLLRQSPFYADTLVFVLEAPNLPAKVERPPFSDGLALQIRALGGVSMHAEPGADREILGVLLDRSAVSVTNGPNWVTNQCLIGVACSSVDYIRGEADGRSGYWIRVRSEDGLEGWVPAEYLVWAD
jgi:hypothetical protein